MKSTVSTVALDDLSAQDFISYYRTNQSTIEDTLYKDGIVKFKGIKINSLDTFQEIVTSISDKFLEYLDGNSPRTKLSSNVYTSTEYDKRQKITMHNELSYSARWPNKLFFSCLQPSETGGETLLADSREIYKHMNPEIVKKIEEHGVIYIRNLNDGGGIGPSWQDTFETEDPDQAEQYCRERNIDFEWLEDDVLRLKQFSKGIIEHRITKEKLWFNQVDQFHPIHLGEELFESLSSIFESTEEFPTYVTYGNGEPIPDEVIKEILETIENVTLYPKWEENELLIVDNELFTHGRNSYTGERRVLVSMSE